MYTPWLARLTAWVAPLRCAACLAPLAASCAQPLCAPCALSLGIHRDLPPSGLDQALYAALDAGPLALAWRAVKYGPALWRAEDIADVWASLPWTAEIHEHDAIVPVPMTRWKRASRGFNQAEVLARALSKTTGWPLDRSTLRRRLWTGTQAARDRRSRRAANNPFACPSPAPRRVVLVDDVWTTGATLSAAAEALCAAGSEHICALTLLRHDALLPSSGLDSP